MIKSFVPTISLLMIGLSFSQNAHTSPANQKSPLAINVAGMQRWNTDWPLIDEMKRAEVVTQCAPTASDCGNNWNTEEYEKVDWDANGWPRSLSGGRFTKISYLLFGGAYDRWDAPPPPTGYFHVLYEGEGSLEYGQAASKVGPCPDRDHCDIVKIETPDTANDLVARISIIATTSDNHLRNIQVIWPGGICNGDVFTYHASAASCTGNYQSFVDLKDQITFHPDYLKDLKHYKAIRFMDFQRANETIATEFDETVKPWGEWVFDMNEETLWANRRLPSYSVWSDSIPVSTVEYPPSRGVPVEVMVELLNVLGSDGWFTVPFAATDNYVQKFARLVKEKLNKGQKIYLEYGNEAWNYAFRGARWIKAKGKQYNWSSSSNDHDEYARQTNWFAKRTIEICNLWKTEWGGDSDRVECVMGGQAASEWVTEHRLLDCELWKNSSENPKKGQTCASQVDALAIAPYFGGYIGDSNYRNQIKDWDKSRVFTEINNGGQLSGAAEVLGIPASPSRYPSVDSEGRPEENQIPVQEVISEQAELLPEAQVSAEATSVGALAEAQGWMSNQAKLARNYGVDLLAYEGGQHLVGINYPSSHDDPGAKVINDKITQLFRNANRDDRMGTAYTRHLNDWKDVGGKLFAVFDAVGPSSQSGSWGIKEYQNQSSPPKHSAVQSFMTNNPCWWAGCDEGVVSYTLPDNQWQQIGLPRALPDGQNTVAKVFGDDLGIPGYNTKWAVYFYDTADGGYVNPGLDGMLQQGVGYWIIQKSGEDATLSLPSGSTTTPEVISTQCPSENGCFEIPLITKDGATGWNMLGHVFESEVRLDQLRVVTKSDSTCAGADGCTLEEAKTAGIVHDQFWRYDGTGYQPLGGSDLIKPWYGLWVATLDSAYNLEPKLLIPAP